MRQKSAVGNTLLVVPTLFHDKLNKLFPVIGKFVVHKKRNEKFIIVFYIAIIVAEQLQDQFSAALV